MTQYMHDGHADLSKADYVDNRVATEASFVDGWFHTGEMGFLGTLTSVSF